MGDGNNMAHSWINASIYFGFTLNVACPGDYMPDTLVLERALNMGARVFVTDEPKTAVAGAHFVNTDVWASMGQEAEQKKREKAFAGYCLTDELLSLADPGVKVLHCLPAHRGEEITEAVFESARSIVFDQAENHLHIGPGAHRSGHRQALRRRRHQRGRAKGHGRMNRADRPGAGRDQ